MIELQDVRRSYRTNGGTVHALDGVDLSIATGEFVAVTGASGSGKSSLLNILGCLDRPDAGRYLIEGEDVAGFDDEATSDIRNRRIGFVFQSFHLLPRLTVLENVLLPLRFHREPPDWADGHARELLEASVGVAERLGRVEPCRERDPGGLRAVEDVGPAGPDARADLGQRGTRGRREGMDGQVAPVIPDRPGHQCQGGGEGDLGDR